MRNIGKLVISEKSEIIKICSLSGKPICYRAIFYGKLKYMVITAPFNTGSMSIVTGVDVVFFRKVCDRGPKMNVFQFMHKLWVYTYAYRHPVELHEILP